MRVLGLIFCAFFYLLSGEASLSEAKLTSLNVYVYDSFVSQWGPGHKIKKIFERNCECEVNFVTSTDVGETMSRIRFEGSNTKADVVILDMTIIDEENIDFYFTPHNLDLTKDNFDYLPIDVDFSTFVPYDWGYLAFVYNSDVVKKPPEGFDDLLKEDISVIIQDPRSSSPGMGLLLWVKELYGNKSRDFWTKFAPKIVKVSRGWGEAYGLFLRGESDMVLSYSTSPAYHRLIDKDNRYKASIFKEGHYVQVEVAVVSKYSNNKELAADFIDSLISDEIQDILPGTNWMYPVKKTESGLPKGFHDIDKPSLFISHSLGEISVLRNDVVREWVGALREVR